MNRPSKQSHLTAKERVRIQTLLDEKLSIRFIAERLNRPPSTISREINRHTQESSTKNCDCIHFTDCDLKHVCGGKDNRCTKRCRTCPKARNYCDHYEKSICDILADGYVKLCNGCSRLKNCHHEKRYYDAGRADREYRKTLTDSRSGYDLTCEELIRINDIVSPRIKKGQSIYHICQTVVLPRSESTIRRMINDCELDARNLDLRSTVSRKERRKRTDNGYKMMDVIKEGRKYEDYLKYIEEHDASVVEMDCVEGKTSDTAAILTLHFIELHFQIAVMLNEHTSEEVVKALDKIEIAIGTDVFREYYPLLLTDNGHEFADIEGMERSINGGKRTMIFFCEPNRSDEKGACENNHKYMRYVIPKGTTIEPLDQAAVTLMMNHVNSFCRRSLMGKCPFDMAQAVLSEDFFIALGLEKISPEEVNLKPELLKNYYHSPA